MPHPPPESVARALSRRYADWDHHNRKNPLEELLFILCSTKTGERSYRETFAALRREFPTFHRIAEAPPAYLARPLAQGGLHNQKAQAIRGIADAIVARFGRLTLAPLKQMDDPACERFLTSLPGVGTKVARCVMMYSLGRAVFPVDTHCWRIGQRLGWIRATQKDGHCAPRDMDRFQSKIPPRLRFSLHVNFVSLGRDCCTARNPNCPRCPLTRLCPKKGVARKSPEP
jgi:endonuclease III